MKSGDGTVRGHRLENRADPAVRDALTRPCPSCKAEPGRVCIRPRWCRRLVHFARCSFREDMK
ncbi:hypothetical protein SEA_EVANESCE_67 [Mycobacterium phage Evanesce]|nr:hypothetical protein SEA_KINBOTE_66 [Mycobacterium phage Kinbote]ALF00288.1 hypothetical protein SEA_EVANESCE_67 [Mycobacterium phage Evanesce]QDH48808.1 hypothetical protein SEA_DEEPSOIL15_68 [Mycobacterium phage DeepSoil15]QIQ62687.1 hypothetical protein SEA_EIN37_68 [Mycobacterium phage Ein37]UXE03477.1 hypothetical protein SEA_AMYMECH_68 [Mycobacterium phage Amymech]